MLNNSLKIIPLWQYELNEAIALAQNYSNEFLQSNIILVNVVSSNQISSEILRMLWKKKIRVISVANHYLNVDADDKQLHAAVQEMLKQEEYMVKVASETNPPEIDKEASLEVARAYNKMSAATPEQRQEFLREYYGEEKTDDDGVR